MPKGAAVQSPLLQLRTCGQSSWLDNLTRPMIQSGELEKRVLHQGLRGITANSATFHKAITGSNAYDAQIKALAREGFSAPDIYERLAVKDAQDACDILREVYESTAGLDGFVSLEVSPHLAYDAQETMRKARRLAGLVNRPNVFIKIPGTAAGVPAIEQMFYEGVNINITLLFSIASYQAVAYAYIRALEHRLHVDRSVRGVASVASFFLSRIDVLVDQLLQQRIGRRTGGGEKRSSAARLLGKVAVANAKVAYQSFKRIFSEDRWTVPETQGARVQRPLGQHGSQESEVS
jgi:transaldolase